MLSMIINSLIAFLFKITYFYNFERLKSFKNETITVTKLRVFHADNHQVIVHSNLFI